MYFDTTERKALEWMVTEILAPILRRTFFMAVVKDMANVPEERLGQHIKKKVLTVHIINKDKMIEDILVQNALIANEKERELYHEELGSFFDIMVEKCLEFIDGEKFAFIKRLSV